MRLMTLLGIFVISLFISSLTGCDTDPIHDEAPYPYPVFHEGDTAIVYEGEEFEIVLYNRMNDAGYSWYIIEEFDYDIVEFIKKFNVIVNPNLLGSPVYEHWRYAAASQGTTSACYKLYQYWMGEDTAIDSAYVMVIVR
jgi:predicted secreted protein